MSYSTDEENKTGNTDVSDDISDREIEKIFDDISKGENIDENEDEYEYAEGYTEDYADESIDEEDYVSEDDHSNEMSERVYYSLENDTTDVNYNAFGNEGNAVSGATRYTEYEKETSRAKTGKSVKETEKIYSRGKSREDNNRKKLKGLYRLSMLAMSAVTMCAAFTILGKISDLEKQTEVQVMSEVRGKDESGKGNEGGDASDIVVTGDGELTLEQIQQMGSNDIIDAFLISKINAPKHQYNVDNFVDEGEFRYYEQDGEKISKVGIDVSSYQGDIDWRKVKRDGVDFAMIRVGLRGYGSGKIVADEKFEQNIEGALEQGIDVGVYFFSQAINLKEARQEAKFVCEMIEDYDLTMPVAFDTEKIDVSTARSNKANLSSSELSELALEFCSYVEDKGYESMIYSNKRWLLRNLNLEKLDKCSIWLAQYSSRLDYPFAFDMWQYTSEGKVDGIKTNVDINVYIPN